MAWSKLGAYQLSLGFIFYYDTEQINAQHFIEGNQLYFKFACQLIIFH